MGGKRHSGKTYSLSSLITAVPRRTVLWWRSVVLHEEQSRVEVINDYDGEVVSLYRVVAHQKSWSGIRWSLVGHKDVRMDKHATLTIDAVPPAAAMFRCQATGRAFALYYSAAKLMLWRNSRRICGGSDYD